MNSLALLVREALKGDPHGDDPYVFRGKSGKLIKILWHDWLGMAAIRFTLGGQGLRVEVRRVDSWR